MGQKTDWPKEAIDTNAMNMLQDILRIWCADYGCNQSSPAGQAKARELIDWFEFGVKDTAQLTALIQGQLAA